MAKAIVRKEGWECPGKNCKREDPHGGSIDDLEGNNKRDGGFTNRVLKKFKYKKGGILNHPFSIQYHKAGLKTLGDLDKYLKDNEGEEFRWGSSAQTHHLICCAAMKSDDWEKICYYFNYNINCPENAVILPATLSIACQYIVPIHRGGHKFKLDEEVFDYTLKVEKEINKVKKAVRSGTICKKEPDELKKRLDAVSKKIWDNLATFRWVLTSQGRKFNKGADGCYGLSSVSQLKKPSLTKSENACNRHHGFSGKLSAPTHYLKERKQV